MLCKTGIWALINFYISRAGLIHQLRVYSFAGTRRGVFLQYKIIWSVFG